MEVLSIEPLSRTNSNTDLVVSKSVGGLRVVSNFTGKSDGRHLVVWIPRDSFALVEHVDDSWAFDRGVKLDGGLKVTIFELLLLDSALSSLDVGSSKGLDLSLGKLVLLVVETETSSTRASEVLEEFELPVSPSGHVVLEYSVHQTVDLGQAAIRVITRAELGDKERDLHLLGVLRPSLEEVEVLTSAVVSLANIVAAVRVLIQDMSTVVWLATWWTFEAQRDMLVHKWRLKPHDGGVAGSSKFLKHSFVEWSQQVLRRLSILIGSFELPKRVPASEWLVDGIEADDVWILAKPLPEHVPVSNELVLQSVDVVVKSSEEADCLNRAVVVKEVILGTVFQERPSLLVLPEAIVIHRLAVAHRIGDWSDDPVKSLIDAVDLVLEHHIGVEVGHSFSTDGASQDILVHVDKSVDAVLTEFVDQLLHLIEVLVPVVTRRSFNRFPHDTEADHVEAPRLEVVHIVLGQAELEVVLSLGLIEVLGIRIRDERSLLVDHVDSVHVHMSSMFVSEVGMLIDVKS